MPAITYAIYRTAEQEHSLNPLEAALEDEQVKGDDTQRNSQVPADSEDFERCAYPSDIRGNRAEIRHEQREHAEGRPTHTESLADQRGQAFARDDAHSGTHLLSDSQAEGREEQNPQQVIAELRARDGVGRDSTGVVIG